MFDYKQIKNDDYVEITYENYRIRSNCGCLYFQGSRVRFVGKIYGKIGGRALIAGIYPDRPDARHFIMKILPSGHFTTYHNSVLQRIITVKKITKGDFTLELI